MQETARLRGSRNARSAACSVLANNAGHDGEVEHVLVARIVDDLVPFAGIEAPEELLAADVQPGTSLLVKKRGIFFGRRTHDEGW